MQKENVNTMRYPLTTIKMTIQSLKKMTRVGTTIKPDVLNS